MPHRTPALAVIVLVVFAGCHAGQWAAPPSTTQSPTATRARTPTGTPTVSCDTFGTGGVFQVADANATVSSREAARAALESARADGSLDAPNATRFSYVPPDAVDSRAAVRDEIRTLPANATLYYFSPDGDTDVHEMAIVSESGRIYRAFVGAC